MSYKEQLDMTRIPRHVAIIMDGNGRWAKQRGLARHLGHQQGVEAVKLVTEMCVSLGVKYLTLYTFSTENWNRPTDEVAALMGLVLTSLEEEIFMKNNVRFNMIGDASRLPDNVLKRIRQTEQRTAENSAMTMTIAMSYSSRWELTEAAKGMARDAVAGKLQVNDITEDTVSHYLTTADMPDPDLLIRTGGEVRISNYLLWQCAYSEFYFCNTFWPDFDGEALCKTIVDFQSRERRYGKTSEQINDNNEQ